MYRRIMCFCVHVFTTRKRGVGEEEKPSSVYCTLSDSPAGGESVIGNSLHINLPYLSGKQKGDGLSSTAFINSFRAMQRYFLSYCIERTY